MLNKEIDMLILGKNYLSFAFAIELLDQRQKVLLLDDERVRFGDLYTNSLGEMEKSFLLSMGRDKDVRPFAELDSYLELKPVLFIFDQVQLRLGGSPYRNLRELARKFPVLFLNKEGQWQVNIKELDGESFNQAYYAFCERLGKILFRYKSTQGLTLADFKTQSPKALWDLYEVFQNSVIRILEDTHDPSNYSLKTFLYMARGVYQKQLSTKATDFELFHLFMELLSPGHLLDHERLLEDLITAYQSRGGQYKETFVREWRFHKGRPWSVELASYEGIIHPKKISLVGGLPKRMPLKLSGDIPCYTCLKLILELDKKRSFGVAGERILFSSSQKIGTDWPMWEAHFFDDRVELKVFMSMLKGSKIEFFESLVLKQVRRELGQIFPLLESVLLSAHLEESYELWIDQNLTKRRVRQKTVPFPREVHFEDASDPGGNSRLRNVYYFGPYKEGPMGLLSSLMEIKDNQQFL